MDTKSSEASEKVMFFLHFDQEVLKPCEEELSFFFKGVRPHIHTNKGNLLYASYGDHMVGQNIEFTKFYWPAEEHELSVYMKLSNSMLDAM